MICHRCNRNVSPFDDHCPDCGMVLKDNPVKSYEGKAETVSAQAKRDTDKMKSEIKSGFKSE